MSITNTPATAPILKYGFLNCSLKNAMLVVKRIKLIDALVILID